jgi:hypothetical protein
MPCQGLEIHLIICILTDFNVILAEIGTVSGDRVSFLVLFIIFLQLLQNLNIIMSINGMMIEQLAKWHHGGEF